ncbi:MAG: hypothetical protein QXG98_01810 [Candidatus Micrarchaeia archaeon]
MRAWLIVLALLLAGCTAEPLAELPGCIALSVREEPELYGLVFVALVGVLFAIAIGYMAAQLFRRPDWEAMVRVELTQTLLGASMIFIAVWLSAFSCSISYELAGGDTFAKANAYLAGLTYGEMIPAIMRLYDKAWQAEKLTAWIIGISSCMSGVCFQPYAGYSMVSYNLGTVAGLLAPIVTSLMVQMLALQFIQQFAFVYLLPLGLLLKAVPFTREAGAFLIALAIGLYVVLPLTYIFNARVMADIGPSITAGSYCALKAGPGDKPGGQALDSTLEGVGGLCSTVIAVVGKILPQAVFLPALNIVITLAFTRTMARIFTRDYMLG